MKTVKFRKLAKRRLLGLVPIPLESRIRKEAFRGGTSISAVMTKYLAAGMGLDPERFGIDADAPDASVN